MRGVLTPLRHRSNATERMDDPACDSTALLRTVDQFASINRLVSRSRTLLTRHVLSDMARNPERTHHLLDLGAGGCDLPVWLLHAAEKRGLRLRISAVDNDPRIVNHARARFGRVANLDIVLGDALDLAGFAPVDYVFANHFLHHLPDAAICALLHDCQLQVRRFALFNDLHRSRSSLLGFHLLASLAYRNSFAHEDGLQSIRRGFTRADVLSLCRKAGLAQTAFGRLLPGRIWLRVPGQP